MFILTQAFYVFSPPPHKDTWIFQVEKECSNQCPQLLNITRSSRMQDFNNRIHQDISQRTKRMDNERKY